MSVSSFAERVQMYCTVEYYSTGVCVLFSTVLIYVSYLREIVQMYWIVEYYNTDVCILFSRENTEHRVHRPVCLTHIVLYTMACYQQIYPSIKFLGPFKMTYINPIQPTNLTKIMPLWRLR